MQWKPAVSIALLWSLAGCDSSPDSIWADALASAPGVAPRLSISSVFQPCSERLPENGSIPHSNCPTLDRSGRNRLTRPGAAVDQGAPPNEKYRLALIDLLLPDTRGIALDRSISSLRELAETAERPAPVLADLAAALLVRAERAQTPRDLLEAYETAEAAARLEPRNRAALFNRALALDRFGLVDEAARDWRAYLAADSLSGWGAEARRRLQALPSPAYTAPSVDAPLRDYERYASVEPQGARQLGMDELLAEWAGAVEAGDAPGAEAFLRRAEVLGGALERRPGGDASLADAVRAIRGVAENDRATRTLARAHREYAAGVTHFAAFDHKRAGARFATAEAAAGASPVLGSWLRVHGATSLYYAGRREDGERSLRALVASADPARYPALAGRARWSLGNILNRTERFEPGLRTARESARLFARAGERENEGAALGIAADAGYVLGEFDSVYAASHQATIRLKPYRASVRLHNLLLATARAADDDGLARAAIRLRDEDVSVAARGAPAYEAEARLARARLLAAHGDGRAGEDVHVADSLFRTLEPGAIRDRLGADLREAMGMISLRVRPEDAARSLDSAATYFQANPLPFRRLRALAGSAEAHLARGEPRIAGARLEEAIRLLDRRRDSIRMEPRRAAVFDAARAVVDRLVMLKLAEGRAAEALDYMDRGRASLAPVGQAPEAGEAAGVRTPPGEVAVEYARVADTLLVWTARGRRVEVFRSVVDTLRLVRTLAALEGRLEDRASAAEVRPALSALYDLLVRPVEERLGAPETPLVVISDGELASVPFAALHDARRGRYLIEDHPLRFAVSLREALRTPAAAPAPGALFVADPAFDRREHPLPPLAHARAEARSLAGGYPEAAVLDGPAATRPALEAALARAGIVHFAGHAVFDDARPERSYLVLAPVPGTKGSGRITAAELSRLDLRHVRLVVLAACRTVRSGPSRAGGFTGLSGGLLAAGAGGALGSTWEVDDRFTAALMAGFHRAYRVSGEGPRALREAQLALLRSRDSTLRTPAAWGGFRYAGR